MKRTPCGEVNVAWCASWRDGACTESGERCHLVKAGERENDRRARIESERVAQMRREDAV